MLTALAAGSRDAGARGFASLPDELKRRIFSLLNVEERARAACVQVSWREALNDGSAWTVLDLSPSSGLPRHRATDATLRGAAAKAGGVGLRSLDVSYCDESRLTPVALQEVVKAHAATLRTLRCVVSLPQEGDCGSERSEMHQSMFIMDIKALLHAAPLLTLAEFSVNCNGAAAELPALLRLTGRHMPLRLHGLKLAGMDCPTAHVHDALHAVAYAHAPQRYLELDFMRLADEHALAALEAACVSVAGGVKLMECNLPRREITVPCLARIASGATLAALHIDHCTAAHMPLLDAAGAGLMGAALRGSVSLTAFTFMRTGLFRDGAVATALLAALTDHPSIRSINLSFDEPFEDNDDEDDDYDGDDDDDDDGIAAAGVALGALAAANAPALTALDVSYCSLGKHLAPLLTALAVHNTHLRTLMCVNNRIFADAHVREQPHICGRRLCARAAGARGRAAQRPARAGGRSRRRGE